MTKTKKKTSEKIIPLPRSLILKLRIDSSQITQALRYNVYTTDGDHCDFESTGPLAGTFNFRKGDNIQIVVEAALHEYKGSFPEFSVINGMIVSITKAAVGLDQPDLSPFNPRDACTSVSAWSYPEKFTPKGEGFPKGNNKTIKYVKVEALQKIIVGASQGQWQMSGYLSTLFMFDAESYSRLYFFDPEGTVGGGTGFGPP